MSSDWDIRFGRRMFESIDREFAEAEEMLDRMFRTIRETGPSEMAVQGPYYYGYQITVGPDRKPHVREFGNVKPSSRGLVEQSGVREPLVDTVVHEKENALTITAEMPGVTKQDIKVDVGEEYVSIHAEKGEKNTPYRHSSKCPTRRHLCKSYLCKRHSGAEIRLKAPPKRKAREVRVE